MNTDTEVRTAVNRPTRAATLEEHRAKVRYLAECLGNREYDRAHTRKHQPWLAVEAHKPSDLTDPVEVLDRLGETDSEGSSPIYGIMFCANSEAVAEALRAFMYNRPTIARCRAAVALWLLEERLRVAMVHSPVRGRGAGEQEVHCIHCRGSIYSSYHQNICGDEETTTPDDFAHLLMSTDDPDSLLERFF